ncbi:MAG: endonuclease III domain-containing protein [Thermoleophilia bacterium]
MAEFLLQRTQPVQVARVFDTFVNRWPDIESVSRARESQLVRALLSLGRSGRVKEIRKAFKFIEVEWGDVPETEEELKLIPGVGNYIARAVLCFALKKPIGLIDPGIIRVFNRFFCLESSKARAHTDKELWEVADSLVPNKNPDGYNLALLDLAALVCTAKSPKHEDCPIKTNCCFIGGA